MKSSIAADDTAYTILQEINAACLRFIDSSYQEFSSLRQSVDTQAIRDAETGKFHQHCTGHGL